MNKALLSIVAVVLVVVIAGGSFYGGMLYGKSQGQTPQVGFVVPAELQGAAANGDFMPGGPGFNGTPGARTQRLGDGQGGGMVFGTIKEIGDGSLILTDSNGNETQVKVTDTTLIEKNASVALADLAPGETLVVSGSAAADGVITARSLQVAPQGRFGMGGFDRPTDLGEPGAQPTPAR